MSSDIRNIDLHLIDEPQNPMRSGMDPVSIADLAESIKVSGLINPITVRPMKQICTADNCRMFADLGICSVAHGRRFEVVAGHRRLLACRLVGMATVPCVVREISDDEVFSIMGTENLERKDTDPVDEALFLARFVGEDVTKIPAAAKLVNRSTAWVEGRLDILNYPDYMIASVKRGDLKLGVAAFIAQVENDRWREMFTRDAIAHGWTARIAEHQYLMWKGGVLDNLEQPPPAPDDLPPIQQARARAMCAKCGSVAEDPNLQSVFIHVSCPSELSEAQG